MIAFVLYMINACEVHKLMPPAAVHSTLLVQFSIVVGEKLPASYCNGETQTAVPVETMWWSVDMVPHQLHREPLLPFNCSC